MSAPDFYFAFWPNKDSSFSMHGSIVGKFPEQEPFFGAFPLHKTATALKPGKNVNDRRSMQWA